MGSSCSLHQRHLQYEQSMREQRLRRRQAHHPERPRSKWVKNDSNKMKFQQNAENEDVNHSTLRYAVVTTIPDTTSSSLFPVEENFVVEASSGLISPKTLSELAAEAVCRNLTNMAHALPRGLPQDVVDDVYNSLIQKCALTSTILKAFRNCEIDSIDLSNCRGVTDEWLLNMSPLENEKEWTNPCTSRFQKMMCKNLSFPSAAIMQRDFHSSQQLKLDMDMDEKEDEHNPGARICTDCVEQQQQGFEFQLNESWSTSSFFSATSNQPIGPDSEFLFDHNNDKLKEDERRPSMDETEVSDDNSNQKTIDSPKSLKIATTPEAPIYTFNESTFSPLNLTTVEPPLCATTNTRVLDLRGCQTLTDQGILQLGTLACLEEAYLDDCHAIMGRGFLSLSQALNLHIVSLRNCRRLTDDGIINLPQHSLETLILEGCRCLTDRSFISISTMSNLVRLDVSQCDQLTDDCLTQLNNLEELSSLNVGWCRKITDKGIDTFTLQVGRRDKLSELILARCDSITEKGIEHLSRLSSLQRLDINGCNKISSASLGNSLQNLGSLTVLNASYIPGVLRTGWQGKINNLKTLDLRYSSVRDTHLTSLFNLPSLEELCLDSCPVSDIAMCHLSDHEVVPNLTLLDLADTNITDLGMSKICKFKKLKHLSLFYCNISNNSLKEVAKLENLEVLNLDNRDISDEGLQHLQNLKKLRELQMYSCRISDQGCSHIANITNLRCLELCGGGITDVGCTTLATLEKLTHLNLSQNDRITNRGAAALAILTNLRSLNLSHTHVNADGLRFFSRLSNLQSLSLFGCKKFDDETRNTSLQDDLPLLRCIRSDSVPALNGMFLADSEEEELTNDDNCVGCEIMWQVPSGVASEIVIQDPEADEASEFSDHD